MAFSHHLGPYRPFISNDYPGGGGEKELARKFLLVAKTPLGEEGGTVRIKDFPTPASDQEPHNRDTHTWNDCS